MKTRELFFEKEKRDPSLKKKRLATRPSRKGTRKEKGVGRKSGSHGGRSSTRRRRGERE